MMSLSSPPLAPLTGPVKLHEYDIYCANDAMKGRDPKSWTLYQTTYYDCATDLTPIAMVDDFNPPSGGYERYRQNRAESDKNFPTTWGGTRFLCTLLSQLRELLLLSFLIPLLLKTLLFLAFAS